MYLLFDAQLWVCCESEDIVSPAGEKMSTKRKAESHSRAASRPRIMKSGDSQVDSERDSGFSGWTLRPDHIFFTLLDDKKSLTWTPVAYLPGL